MSFKVTVKFALNTLYLFPLSCGGGILFTSFVLTVQSETESQYKQSVIQMNSLAKHTRVMYEPEEAD